MSQWWLNVASNFQNGSSFRRLIFFLFALWRAISFTLASSIFYFFSAHLFARRESWRCQMYIVVMVTVRHCDGTQSFSIQVSWFSSSSFFFFLFLPLFECLFSIDLLIFSFSIKFDDHVDNSWEREMKLLIEWKQSIGSQFIWNKFVFHVDPTFKRGWKQFIEMKALHRFLFIRWFHGPFFLRFPMIFFVGRGVLRR